MGIGARIKMALNNVAMQSAFKMITEQGNGFYSWNGQLFQSDIIRSCIRPYAKAIGKLKAKHIRNVNGTISVNPDAYMRFLLEEPNLLMSGQVMQEKVATQLALNNNAFILIVRDDNGMPQQLYPIPAAGVEAKYIGTELYLKFYFLNGNTQTFPYTEIIHLRNDFNENDIFGESPEKSLKQIMDVLATTDQGIINAIKNSGAIRWLLKYSTPMRPEDLKENVQQFVDNYLSVSSKTFGAAGADAKADVIRIEPKDYVPNALQMDNTKKRLYAFFNTNEKIVHSDYTEDEWNSYFESAIEPTSLQLSNEYTRKLFNRRERGFGNSIYFDAFNLQSASLSTKLSLVSMVDRGALLVNEWRNTFNLSPIPGGDIPIRRLDTETVDKVTNLLSNMQLDNIAETKAAIYALLKGGEKSAEKD
ncbi:MAG: phage portal protein [Lacrimispora sphenoides]